MLKTFKAYFHHQNSTWMCVVLKGMLQKCHFKLMQRLPIALFILVASKIGAVSYQDIYKMLRL